MHLNNWGLHMEVYNEIDIYLKPLKQQMVQKTGWTLGLSFIGVGGYRLRHFVVSIFRKQKFCTIIRQLKTIISFAK